MKDDLKNSFDKFNDADTHDPQEGHLDRFIDRLDNSNKTLSWMTTLKWAASIALLVGVGYFLMKDSNQDMPIDVVAQENIEERAVTDDLEIYFAKKVNNKVMELKNIDVGDTTIVYESMQELEVLEEEYQELKNKLEKHGPNKLIVKAMAQNYRTRLKLLDLLITRLEFNVTEEEPVKKTKENKHTI